MVNQEEFTIKIQEYVAFNSGGRAEYAEMILNIEIQKDSNVITNGALENALKNFSIEIKQDFDLRFHLKVIKDLASIAIDKQANEDQLKEPRINWKNLS